jgi:hypothetical protein
MASTPPGPSDSQDTWLSSSTDAEVAGYVLELLTATRAMARQKGFERLARLIAEAADEAALHI